MQLLWNLENFKNTLSWFGGMGFLTAFILTLHPIIQVKADDLNSLDRGEAGEGIYLYPTLRYIAQHWMSALKHKMFPLVVILQYLLKLNYNISFQKKNMKDILHYFSRPSVHIDMKHVFSSLCS